MASDNTWHLVRIHAQALLHPASEIGNKGDLFSQLRRNRHVHSTYTSFLGDVIIFERRDVAGQKFARTDRGRTKIYTTLARTQTKFAESKQLVGNQELTI